ncbi:hypothetical protein AURDEDRAFT_140600 [Auricularia subglabra TFB-10046 SS5]|uniref:DUF6533 domain-containing protein n=1 Tax=Auricularia subglabra (strain TFB-10046 / SS5) TaxID=717982 RepID=J0D5P3_AURST|nr:hypothetical protein AURDEDRAFT_140600 [Auricularia subglabra TFB-10046 SS5]
MNPAAEIAALNSASIYKVYDYFLTLSDEVELVWPSSLSLAQVLFYSSRYSMWPETCLELLFYFGTLDDRECRILSAFLGFSLVIGMFLAQGIVVLRTWALWNSCLATKFAFIVVGTMCAAVCAYLAVEWGLETRYVQVSAMTPQAQGCAIMVPYRLVWIGWALFCFNDVALLCMTAIKYRQHFRPGSPKLTAALYRDAFTYFSGMLCTMERTLYSTVAGRIIIGLRAAARAPESTIDLNYLLNPSGMDPLQPNTPPTLAWPG